MSNAGTFLFGARGDADTSARYPGRARRGACRCSSSPAASSFSPRSSSATGLICDTLRYMMLYGIHAAQIPRNYEMLVVIRK